MSHHFFLSSCDYLLTVWKALCNPSKTFHCNCNQQKIWYATLLSTKQSCVHDWASCLRIYPWKMESSLAYHHGLRNRPNIHWSSFNHRLLTEDYSPTSSRWVSLDAQTNISVCNFISGHTSVVCIADWTMQLMSHNISTRLRNKQFLTHLRRCIYCFSHLNIETIRCNCEIVV